MQANKLITAFIGTDMRCQHIGLAAIAKGRKVNVYELKTGEHVVFINTALNRIKMFSPGGVLSYLRVDGRIDMGTLSRIPRAFAGDLPVAYGKALKEVLEKKFNIGTFANKTSMTHRQALKKNLKKKLKRA